MSKYIDLQTPEGRNSFYQTKEWRAIRRIVLTEQPYCIECLKEGIHTVATEVDHIIDIKDAPTRCLDITNMQSMCKSCHARKTYKTSMEGAYSRQTTYETVNKKWKNLKLNI